MGLVAQANAALAGGDPRALKRLSVQFRGMGVPEQEIVVTGTVKSVDGDRVVIDTVAAQGENELIKNAEAELELYGGVGCPSLNARGASPRGLGEVSRRAAPA